jgi:hypothetical protein
MLGQAIEKDPMQEEAESEIGAEIKELNLRLKAQEQYKKYGLALGVFAILLRLFRK